MPMPERGDTSYVTVEVTCGHEIRIARIARPTRTQSVFCFTCNERFRVVKVTDDKEWLVRCTDCRYAERCGKSGVMKAQRHAATHYKRRRHSVRVFHENDPNGTEKWFRDPSWKELAQMPPVSDSGFPEEPPF